MPFTKPASRVPLHVDETIERVGMPTPTSHPHEQRAIDFPDFIVEYGSIEI
jgi:hypothetical protein